MNFNQFRKLNRSRAGHWHPKGIESWSPSDWVTAIVGELGEMASLVKMRNRERDGLPGNKFSPTDEQIAKEAADVFTYLDLFCAAQNINLGSAVASKFNEVSNRVGFPERVVTADRFALWPDDFMCPADEVEEMLRPPCARSDDFQWVIVTAYDYTGSPTAWVPEREYLRGQRSEVGLPTLTNDMLRYAMAAMGTGSPADADRFRLFWRFADEAYQTAKEST